MSMGTGDRYVDLTERILHLRSIPVGAMLPAAVLKTIAGCLRERTFDAGTVLMRGPARLPAAVGRSAALTPHAAIFGPTRVLPVRVW